jgi:hypothetical protein
VEIVVVSNQRGDRRKQARRRRDQGFGNSWRNRAQAGGARVAQTGECVHHAPNCSEESDERRDRSYGRESRHAPLKPPHFFASGNLHLDTDRIRVLQPATAAAGAGAVHLRFQFSIARRVDRYEWTGPYTSAERIGIGEPPAAPKHHQKLFGFAVYAAQLRILLQDERPGKNGQNEKESKDYTRNAAGLLQKGERVGEEQNRRAGNRFPPENNFWPGKLP